MRDLFVFVSAKLLFIHKRKENKEKALCQELKYTNFSKLVVGWVH